MRRHDMVRTKVLAIAITAATFAAANMHAQMQRQRTTSVTHPSQPAVTTPVNLNTATTADLEALPGIGPAMAARIIEYRQKNSGFKKIEDLMNVKGIGEKVFLK